MLFNTHAQYTRMKAWHLQRTRLCAKVHWMQVFTIQPRNELACTKQKHENICKSINVVFNMLNITSH